MQKRHVDILEHTKSKRHQDVYILPDTWKSSVILDVGLDSSLLERLLSDVHDLLRCS